MVHVLRGVIGTTETLKAVASDWGHSPPVPLRLGLGLIPLTNDWLDRLSGSAPEPMRFEGFAYLSDPLLQNLRQASFKGALVYAETEYFGGDGGQGAVVLDQGKNLFGPEWATFGPINRALEHLGVAARDEGLDAFDQVGLGARRTTTDWIAQ